MHTAKVVIHEVKRDGGNVILQLLRERIGQPYESTNAHTHGEILAFNEMADKGGQRCCRFSTELLPSHPDQ
jgi:hypothetical protein